MSDAVITSAAARPSMTQGVYMGRRTVDSQVALALEAALRGTSPDGQFRGKGVDSEGGEYCDLF
jgi:hypothetical protein